MSTFVGSARRSGVALMTIVVAPQSAAASNASASPSIPPPGERPARPTATPRKASARPSHWIQRSRSSFNRKTAPSATKNGAAKTKTVARPAVVQRSDSYRAMNSAVKRRPASAPAASVPSMRKIRRRIGHNADAADRRTNARLRNRPDVDERDLGDDLVEAPEDAERKRERSGKRVEGSGFHPSPSPFGAQKSRPAGLSLDPPP